MFSFPGILALLFLNDTPIASPAPSKIKHADRDLATESGSDTSDANGEITLGGVDTSKYTGALTYFPTLNSGRHSSLFVPALVT